MSAFQFQKNNFLIFYFLPIFFKKYFFVKILEKNKIKKMSQIFLDNAAGAPILPEVREKMRPFLENFGNPSGLNFFSRRAKTALERARDEFAEILGCENSEIIFTSGGTESNNLAIFGVAENFEKNFKNEILTSEIEHPSVLRPIEKLIKKNFTGKFLQPKKNGEISPEIFKKNISEKSFLASFFFGNNEIGTKNPLEKLAEIARENGVILHTDACQILSTEKINLRKLNVDLLSANSAKIGGPRGVGALFCRKKIKIAPQILGGSQENSRRGGTENLAGIVGFVEAAKIAQKNLQKNSAKLQKFSAKIINFVREKIPDARLNGDEKNRLPGNLNFSFLNLEGESLALFLDELGFSVATGSACASASLEPSHVLRGIGLPPALAHSSIRVSFSAATTEKNIDEFLRALQKSVEKLRQISATNFSKKNFPEFF